ncbi:MAG: NAD(P)/FAD-dependent oxidoreductase [Fusobacteriaceae bacterium]
MKKYDLIVVGAGPSGIFTAIEVASHGKKVLLIEKNKKIGKKLLIAGQGRCNLTNSCELKEFLLKYGDGGRFLKSALNEFKPKDMINWFKDRGMNLVLVEETGKYFPETMRSLDVLSLLEKEMRRFGVEILLDGKPDKIERKDSGYSITVGENSYYGENLLIATGGASYPATGTTGDGYLYAKKLGHKIVTPKPCLTPVYVDNYSFSDLSGISFSGVKIDLWRDGKIYKSTKGDILLTHHNLSGPGIIDFSRYIVKDDILGINFVGVATEEFQKKIIESAGSNGKQNIKNFLLTSPIPERFVKKMLSIWEIDESKKLSEISKVERASLLQLTNYKMRVTRLGGMEIAMATTGGVSLEEINPKTMESKISENLYFTGEVLDIDGDTGGFNIQAAFSTGYLVRKHILKKSMGIR